MSRAAGGNQPSRLLSVVEKMPALGDRGVQLEKVAQSGAITSADTCIRRVYSRESAGDHVCVDELVYVEGSAQKIRRGRALASAVRTSEQDQICLVH
jgi:hypothetical protein